MATTRVAATDDRRIVDTHGADGLMRSSTTVRRRWSDLRVGPVAALLVLATAGCAAASPTVSDAARVTAPTTVAPGTIARTAAPAPAPAPAASTGAPAPRADAAKAFHQAMDALRPGYDLTTDVTLGDQVITRLTGRVIGQSSALALTTNGATVEYLEIPPLAWAREPGGQWAELDQPAPVQDPFEKMGNPTAIAEGADAADGRHVKATYDARSLGAAPDGTVEADVLLAAAGKVVVTYPSSVGGKQIIVRATLAPTADASPISPPA